MLGSKSSDLQSDETVNKKEVLSGRERVSHEEEARKEEWIHFSVSSKVLRRGRSKSMINSD